MPGVYELAVCGRVLQEKSYRCAKICGEQSANHEQRSLSPRYRLSDFSSMLKCYSYRYDQKILLIYIVMISAHCDLLTRLKVGSQTGSLLHAQSPTVLP